MLARVMAEMRAAREPRRRRREGDPHAAVPAPSAPAAGRVGARRRRPRAPALAGVIELPDALRSRVGPGALVFVTVRDAGGDRGPAGRGQAPARRRRSRSRSRSGPADSMMGQPLPARARVEARVDSDGDPLTRDPGDPSARLDGVAAGSRACGWCCSSGMAAPAASSTPAPSRASRAPGPPDGAGRAVAAWSFVLLRAQNAPRSRWAAICTEGGGCASLWYAPVRAVRPAPDERARWRAGASCGAWRRPAWASRLLGCVARRAQPTDARR